MNRFFVLTYAWHGDKSLDILFPTGWDVKVSNMAGHDAPPLTEAQIRERLTRPIGTRPLREIAEGKKECVVIVDDLTRPTRAWQVLPAVLDELHAGGITDGHIRFVMATGAHHFMRLGDLVKKLGEDIPDRYCVFVHNVYENNIPLGKTSYGTPVAINREVMECDLKVAVGGIIPHMGAGFGGGGKIVLPGVASIDSIEHNHKHVRTGRGEGRIEGNTRRLDSEEAARMVGIDFIVNMIINPNRDCCGLFCGDLVEAHREGVRVARKHYVTKIEPDVDVAVVNGYPMECEAYKALSMAAQSVREGGDAVIILHAPEGARGHYYNGRFGMGYGGRGWSPDVYTKRSWRMSRIIAVAPHHSLADEVYYGRGSVWVKSWAEALDGLYSSHDRLARVRVAVYPYAPIQISEKNAALP